MAKSPNRPKSTTASANPATPASVPAVPQTEASVPDGKTPRPLAHVAPWVAVMLTALGVVAGAIAYYKGEVNALDRRISDLQRDVATQGERDKASAEAQSAQIEAMGKRIERLEDRFNAKFGTSSNVNVERPKPSWPDRVPGRGALYEARLKTFCGAREPLDAPTTRAYRNCATRFDFCSDASKIYDAAWYKCMAVNFDFAPGDPAYRPLRDEEWKTSAGFP